MVAHVYTTQQRTRSLIAVISAVFATGVAVGALVPLISLRMEREGFSSFVIGVNALMLPLAVMTAGPFVPKLAARFGTLNAIYLSTAVLSGLTLSLPFLPIMPAWFVVRFLEGVAAAVGWIITETWVNLMATESNRTRVIAVYATVLAVGFAIGPLVIRMVGIDGVLPFGVIAALLAVSALPIAWARDVAPTMPGHSTHGVLRLIAAAPVIMLAGLGGGAIESAGYALLPVYGVKLGLAEATAVLMLTMYYAGNLVLQIPLAMLADRFDRRHMLVACFVVALVCPVLLPLTLSLSPLMWAVLVAWGGATMAIYTMSLAVMGDSVPRAELAGANAAFVMMYELGSIGGPAVAGGAMDLAGPNGLMVVLGLIAGGYLAAIGLLRVRR
ncbi:MAG: MFS transporter [Dongiaceae bacterium]